MEYEKREKLIKLILEFGSLSMDVGNELGKIGENDKFDEISKERSDLFDELINYIYKEL